MNEAWFRKLNTKFPLPKDARMEKGVALHLNKLNTHQEDEQESHEPHRSTNKTVQIVTITLITRGKTKQFYLYEN